jgi:hypothetical protein
MVCNLAHLRHRDNNDDSESFTHFVVYSNNGTAGVINEEIYDNATLGHLGVQDGDWLVMLSKKSMQQRREENIDDVLSDVVGFAVNFRGGFQRGREQETLPDSMMELIRRLTTPDTDPATTTTVPAPMPMTSPASVQPFTGKGFRLGEDVQAEKAEEAPEEAEKDYHKSEEAPEEAVKDYHKSEEAPEEAEKVYHKSEEAPEEAEKVYHKSEEAPRGEVDTKAFFLSPPHPPSHPMFKPIFEHLCEMQDFMLHISSPAFETHQSEPEALLEEWCNQMDTAPWASMPDLSEGQETFIRPAAPEALGAGQGEQRDNEGDGKDGEGGEEDENHNEQEQEEEDDEDEDGRDMTINVAYPPPAKTQMPVRVPESSTISTLFSVVANTTGLKRRDFSLVHNGRDLGEDKTVVVKTCLCDGDCVRLALGLKVVEQSARKMETMP